MPWRHPQNVKIENFTGRDVVLPKGRVDLSFSVQDREDYLGTFNAEITFNVNGSYATKTRISAFIRVMNSVAVCGQKIERDAPVAPGDVTMEIRDLASLSKEVVTDRESIVGKRAKSTIQQGMLLKPDMFENNPDVHKGDVITISVDNAYFKITAPAEALEDGNRGDTIQVCNLTSKNNIFGIVKNSKEVEVRY